MPKKKVPERRELLLKEGAFAERQRIRGILRRLARECDAHELFGYAWAASAYRNASREIGRRAGKEKGV